MARTLSSQFLGAQHAVDIIPHTAILVFGKEYYFGMGIQSCSPHEFRTSRGIHPIEIQLLGHTTQTREQFELWCHEQTMNGKFNASAYDFFQKNCNNFSEEAAKSGLGLSAGVPSHILDLPSKFLNSPMGRMVRPWLEQMQIMNNNSGVTTTTTTETSSFESMVSSSPSSTLPSEVATFTNPWANIPSNTSLLSQDTTSIVGADFKVGASTKPLTPLLDKQTALLSSDAKIVNICVNRLKTVFHKEEKKEEELCQLFLTLLDSAHSWAVKDLQSAHSSLCHIIKHEGSQYISYSIMLLRLVILKPANTGLQNYDGIGDNTATMKDIISQTIQLMATLVYDEEGTSVANRAMAWCVLSNAIGSNAPVNWHSAAFALGDVDKGDRCEICEYSFNQILDRALYDCDSSKESSSSTSLRQSAAAFLYNSSIYLTININEHEGLELSECLVCILLGCVEHLQTESDATTMQRLFMTMGQMLTSRSFGFTAATLLCDLGMMDEEVTYRCKNRGGKIVEGLANEVAAILRSTILES